MHKFTCSFIIVNAANYSQIAIEIQCTDYLWKRENGSKAVDALEMCSQPRQGETLPRLTATREITRPVVKRDRRRAKGRTYGF